MIFISGLADYAINYNVWVGAPGPSSDACKLSKRTASFAHSQTKQGFASAWVGWWGRGDAVCHGKAPAACGNLDPQSSLYNSHGAQVL